jgi:hypothetical protein
MQLHNNLNIIACIYAFSMNDPMNQPQYRTYEDYLNRGITRPDTDKSFTDKLLGREDANRLKDLISKDDLTREDLSEILNLISSINSKLVNYSDWDRYALGKYYTWIRSFIKINQEVIKMKDEIDHSLLILDTQLKDVSLSEDDREFILKAKTYYLETNDLVIKTRDFGLDDSKFIIDVFLFMSNSTMSVSAAAFDKLSSSRYEYSYPVSIPATASPEAQKKSVFGFLRGK